MNSTITLGRAARPAQHPAVGLVVALVVLAMLQGLHLLDDLRTDPGATLVSSLLKPQAVAGIGGALGAAVLVAIGHRWGRPLALVSASLVSLGFLLVHGIPIKSGPLHPYWGAGSADAVQWAGVLLIWTCSAYVILASTGWARRPARGLELVDEASA